MKIKLIILALSLSILVVPAYSKEVGGSKLFHAQCAASNGILGIKMESGMIADVMVSEAKRHSGLARSKGATNPELNQIIDYMSSAFNAKKINWDKLVEFSKLCSKFF